MHFTHSMHQSKAHGFEVLGLPPFDKVNFPKAYQDLLSIGKCPLLIWLIYVQRLKKPG